MQPFQTGNTACLVVDIQERLTPFLDGGGTMTERSRILLQGLTAVGVPVAAATEQYPKGLGHTEQAIRLLLNGAPVFEKTRFSAWIPEVRDALARLRAANVILIGAEAHICMLQTVLDLRAAGLETYVPLECTASRSGANKENALQQMHRAGAVVSNVESILFQLLADASHEAFKTVSKLIR